MAWAMRLSSAEALIMAELFVRRPNAHHHLLAVIILCAMAILLSMLAGHRPLPGVY